MAISYPNILKHGLQASYDALAVKDSNVLYFCEDTGKIFKGTVEFTKSVIIAETKPAAPIVGKVYIIGATGTVEVFDGTDWKVVSYPTVTTISAEADQNDDVHVPSAKAVQAFVADEIAKAVGGEGVIAKVEVDETEGKVKVTDGKGNVSHVAVHGAVTTPTYEAATRKFTFPVVDGDDVVVELGKDIFVDASADNRYEDGNLYIYLNDGTEGKAATELVIPVTSLVTDYFGDDTDTIAVTVDNETHKVTADAVVRPDGVGGFVNALKVSTVDGAKGLYVDLSAYNTAEEVDAKVKVAKDAADAAQASADEAMSHSQYLEDEFIPNSIATAVGELETKIDEVSEIANTAANDATEALGRLDIIEGEGEGSIKKAVADESKALKEGPIALAQTAADSAQATADENAEKIAALAQATTVWGTF